MAALARSRSFGIEEEYLLLDATSGTPVNLAVELISAASASKGLAEHEYFCSQIEIATPICYEAEEAETFLTHFRATVAKDAFARNVLLAGIGLPPVGGDTAGTVAPKARYRLIEAEVRAAAKHQYSTGMHVHVEVPSSGAGIDVLSRLARWAPTLLALTANSPLWCGEPTGFASWRHIMGLTWPVNGYPLGFEDAGAYDRSVVQLVQTGVIPDAGLLTWVARLSQNYPTIELRIADAQLEARDSVAFAVIVRALVDRALTEAESGVERPNYSTAVVNGSNWMAARNGLSSELIDPLTGIAYPAFDLISRMLATVDGELEGFGDRERVDHYIQRLRDDGGPAGRQLATFAAYGLGGLLELYRGGQLEVI